MFKHGFRSAFDDAVAADSTERSHMSDVAGAPIENSQPFQPIVECPAQ